MTWTTCLSAMAPEAHLAKGYLEHRGVPCILVSEGPTLYPVPTFGMRVLVPDDWLLVARKMLEVPVRRPRRAAGGRLKSVA